jgi:hypothetical protein
MLGIPGRVASYIYQNQGFSPGTSCSWLVP